MTNWETLAVAIDAGVARIELNRPAKANAVNSTMWRELASVFAWVDAHAAAWVIVFAGAGPHCCSGIDLEVLAELREEHAALPEGRGQEHLLLTIRELQAAVTAIEHCRKPVITAVHGVCLAGGDDIGRPH